MSPRLIVPALLTTLGALPAVETPFVGPRGAGMGGANVASTDSAIAQYYNPAVFGFMNADEDRIEEENKDVNDNNDVGHKFLGINLIDATVGYRLTGDIVDKLEDISEIDVDVLGTDSSYNEAQVNELLRAAALLADIVDPENVIIVELNGGSHVRIGNLAVGARVHSQVAAAVLDVDLTNLGLSYADLNGPLDDARGGTTPTGSTLTPTQEADLATAGVSAANIDYIDSLITDQINDGTISNDDVNNVIDTLIDINAVTVAGSGDLEDNTTSVIARGAAFVEIPVSYGYEVIDNFSVGGSVKAIFGRVYGTRYLVFDEDNDEIIDRATEDYEETTTFGIDVSALYRMPTLNLGITARNLNEPKLDGFRLIDGFRIQDVDIERQVTIGAAWFPLWTIVVEANLELLEREALVGNYDTQYFTAGAEFDVLSTLALRGGFSQNIAASDIGPVISAGLGVNMYLVRLDLAAAVSMEQEDFDGTDVPSEGRVSLGLSIEF